MDNKKSKRVVKKVETKEEKSNLTEDQLNEIVLNLRKMFIEIDLINADIPLKDFENKVERFFKIIERKEKVEKKLTLTEKDLNVIRDKLIEVFENAEIKRKREYYENIFSKKNINCLKVIDYIKSEMMRKDGSFISYLSIDDVEETLGHNHRITNLLEDITNYIDDRIEKYKESE